MAIAEMIAALEDEDDRIRWIAGSTLMIRKNERVSANLDGSISWIEIPRNDEVFVDFLGQVVALLDAPDLPPAGEKCSWCSYRVASRKTGY